ncbi:MAG TPA: undecaprenyl-diphosphate phosphatase [Patescibacteria group bacterium]|nr:undecaprenyl-diphosphate phosphatase [Patescibacteria group bacterium]
METLLQAIVMGIVQGLTEFLPISSSGHLLVVPWLAGWDDPFIASLSFTVMLHVGTLMALIAYFWRDWARLVPAGLAALRDRSFRGDPDRKLAWLIAVTLPPAVIVGVALRDFFEDQVRHELVVALTLTIGAGILWAADRLGRRTRDLDGLGFGGAFAVGCAQALALVPGISRSGISISAGLFAGLTREAAARFSFLMATPITFGAVIWEVRKVATGEVDMAVDAGVLAAGVIASAGSGFVAIAILLRYLRNHPMTVFVAYRLALAGIVVVHFLATQEVGAPPWRS